MLQDTTKSQPLEEELSQVALTLTPTPSPTLSPTLPPTLSPTLSLSLSLTLSLTLSQSKFAPQLQGHDLALGDLHRDTISHVLFLPKTQSYVTASPDSTLRIWHGTSLRPA